MELAPSIDHIVRGILMVGATGIVQVVAQLVLSRTLDILPSPPESRYPTFYMLTHSVTAVMILLVGHVVQVAMWAVLYFYDWGAFKSFGVAIYFSLASFTTLGASELVLPSQHPPHIGIETPEAEKHGELKPHRDGTRSIYIPDSAGNAVELLAPIGEP